MSASSLTGERRWSRPKSALAVARTTALELETRHVDALCAARLAARAAASTRARQLVRTRPQRPQSAVPTIYSAIGPPRTPLPMPTRASTLAAKQLLVEMREKKRSPWGFFLCQLLPGQLSELNLMRVGAPAALSAGDGDDGAAASESARTTYEDVLLARPAVPEERRLAFGPFAFRLSPSSEVLAWLAVTRMRDALRGARVLELGSGLGFTGLAVEHHAAIPNHHCPHAHGMRPCPLPLKCCRWY
jgi:hypothetical protein